MKPVAEIQNLVKTYRDFWGRNSVPAVKNISFDVLDGEVFGLLGPNGSGKTTTIKLLLGLLFPTSGNIKLMGKSASTIDTHKYIGYLPEESYLYKFLNADEILHFYGKIFGLSRSQRNKKIDELIKMVGLEHARKRKLKAYSKGMMRRIGIAQALINDPKFIILDEPTSGLDPIGSREVKDLVLALKEQGKTVLMCSHLLADVEDVCDRIAIMYEGNMECIGKVDELLTVGEEVQMNVKNPNENFIQGVESMAMSSQIGLTVQRPRRRLEELFLEIVQKNKK